MASTVSILPDGSEFILKTPYTHGELKGIVILIVVSILSTLAVIGLLVALGLSAWNTRKSANPNLFIRSRVAAYFISLLLCDLCQGVGSLMNSRWYMNGAVTYEPFCTAQGALKQIADVGNAYWNTTIAMNAFWILFLRWKVRTYVMYAVLIGGWSAIGTLIMVGPAAVQSNSKGPFYGISGYWCWISNGYEVSHITLDYMFMFSSAVVTFVLYLLIFLNLRGNIWVNGWRVSFSFPRDAERAASRGVDDHAMKVAKQMLLYPLSYTIMILPIGVCRFMEWAGHDVPFTATIFSDAIYLTSGVANVILFAVTRRILPPHSVIPKSVARLFGRRREPHPDMFTTDLERLKHDMCVAPLPAGVKPASVPVSLPHTPPRVSVQPAPPLRLSHVVLGIQEHAHEAKPPVRDAFETDFRASDDVSRYSSDPTSVGHPSPDRGLYSASSPPGLPLPANTPLPVTARTPAVPPHGSWL
ncbi:hypothetical protein OBBRIDRAFT_794688 [Obba rivulosa]|uniref:Glucose receptor Git3 N-terminal domain-containing protein n=1 Tax=Obba rivulosa TaxID=1052685 RepID=A0A8E2DKM8_9APHY|nr:hypothetical protein OBBRIDRAFT_794688 [Obba rivulosa]